MKHLSRSCAIIDFEIDNVKFSHIDRLNYEIDKLISVNKVKNFYFSNGSFFQILFKRMINNTGVKRNLVLEKKYKGYRPINFLIENFNNVIFIKSNSVFDWQVKNCKYLLIRKPKRPNKYYTKIYNYKNAIII